MKAPKKGGTYRPLDTSRRGSGYQRRYILSRELHTYGRKTRRDVRS